jgi:hypothetical protein
MKIGGKRSLSHSLEPLQTTLLSLITMVTHTLLLRVSEVQNGEEKTVTIMMLRYTQEENIQTKQYVLPTSTNTNRQISITTVMVFLGQIQRVDDLSKKRSVTVHIVVLVLLETLLVLTLEYHQRY